MWKTGFTLLRFHSRKQQSHQPYSACFFSTNTDDDLQHAIRQVRTYDPAGYLPGQLLPTQTMQHGYYAVRSFWVETGLRKQTLTTSSSSSSLLSHDEYSLQAWRDGIETIFSSTSTTLRLQHPTLRLLHSLRPSQFTCIDPFLQILQARQYELESNQLFHSLTEMKQHATKSCGNLISLVLLVGNKTPTTHPYSHQAAQHLGVAHGLVNALRMSIPVLSNTGRLLLPQDLLQEEGVTKPRYLLSALSQGDEMGTAALARVVERMALEARCSLDMARQFSNAVREEESSSTAVLLPSFALETYLDRLASKQYRLTDRSLRNVSWMEHGQCAFRMIRGYYTRTY